MDDEFVTLLTEHFKAGTTWSQTFRVDGVDLTFQIVKKKLHPRQITATEVVFGLNAFWSDIRARCQHMGDFNSIPECVSKLGDAFQYKFFKSDLLPVLLDLEMFRLNSAAVAFYRKKINLEADMCYVCLQSIPDDHKTRCDHPICYKDFVKSIKGSTFICGICRTAEYFSDEDD